MSSKILITKNDTFIMISNDGKRLVIDEDNKLFNELKDKTKEEIKEWYINRK